MSGWKHPARMGLIAVGLILAQRLHFPEVWWVVSGHLELMVAAVPVVLALAWTEHECENQKGRPR